MAVGTLGADAQKILDSCTFCNGRQRKRKPNIHFFLCNFAAGLLFSCAEAAYNSIATEKSSHKDLTVGSAHLFKIYRLKVYLESSLGYSKSL